MEKKLQYIKPESIPVSPSPINKEELELEFRKKQPIWDKLLKEALFILEGVLKERKIKIHSIPYREKTFESFFDKATRKDLKNPTEEITDVVGLRVICLFLSDIELVCKTLKESFHVLSEENKVEGQDIATFGYMSVHSIVSIKKEYKGPRYDDIIDIPFEIQVRTIAMDAWDTIAHYLEYKNDIDVPKELRRDFYALSGLFYVADTHFEMFFKEKTKAKERLVELFEKPVPLLNQEINLDSLSAYLRNKFPDRKHSDASSISELVSSLTNSGYKTISDLDKAIDSGMEAFNRFENRYPPHKPRKFAEVGFNSQLPPEKAGKYAEVGVVRVLLHLIDEAFLKEDEKDEKRKAFMREYYSKYESNSIKNDVSNKKGL